VTITPPRGTSGTARTAARNRRRRPPVPGEPRHAANSGPGYEETPPRVGGPSWDPGSGPMSGPGAHSQASGLGAQLYQVLSESERESAVAETLLFVKPDAAVPAGAPMVPGAVGGESVYAESGWAEPGRGERVAPAHGAPLHPEPGSEAGLFAGGPELPVAETHLFPRVSLTEAELADNDLPATVRGGTDIDQGGLPAGRPVEAFAWDGDPDSYPAPATETVLFARPADWDRAEHLVAEQMPERAPVAKTILFTRPAAWHEIAERYRAAQAARAGRRKRAAPVAPIEAGLPAEAVALDGARPGDRAEAGTTRGAERPGRREVSPLTETFLFGTPVRHAQEPRSPIDGTAETLLFAGLARALATQPDDGERPPGDEPSNDIAWSAGHEPPNIRDWPGEPELSNDDARSGGHELPSDDGWLGELGRSADGGWSGDGAWAGHGERPGEDGSGLASAVPGEPVDRAVDGLRRAGFAGDGRAPAYRGMVGNEHSGPGGNRRAWTDLDQNAAEPRIGTDGAEVERSVRRGRRKRGRGAFSEEFDAGAGRSGRVVNRKRSRAADLNAAGVNGLWNTAHPPRGDESWPGENARDLEREGFTAPPAGLDKLDHGPIVSAPAPEPAVLGHRSAVDDSPVLNPAMHGLEPALHELEPALHELDPELLGPDAELHRFEPDPHAFDPELHGLDPELHGLDPELHGLDPELHGLHPELHGLDPALQGLDPELLGLDAELLGLDAGSAEAEAERARGLSPERLAKAAAAEAAWRAFAEGDREPGAEIRTNRRARSRWLTTLTGGAAGEADQDASHAAAGEPDDRPAGNVPKRPFFLWPVILRCLLYLGPLSVAVAAVGALGRVAWPVPALTLLLGWATAQALTSVGVTVSRRAGPEAAVRLVGAGFAAVTGLWCALVWIAPHTLLGPDRLLAAAVGAGGLATLATVTAALVSRSEMAMTRWYLPCWLLAGTALAAAAGAGWAGYVPVETLLPAAIVAVLVRAFRPAVLPARECRIPRLTAVERRRGVAYLVIGVSQALCVALLWQAGPAITPSPAALPLLLAVPMLEALIGWHTNRIDAGLDSAESAADLDRHVRNVTVITLAGLLPPLAAGGALALAAYRLPYGLGSLHGAQGAVLALAAGTLLGGVFAITFLLAARSRTGLAATLAAAPPLATCALPLLPQPEAGPLPVAVAVLAATHVAGLLIVALTAADLRRTS
jgi:hypothetical protein